MLRALGIILEHSLRLVNHRQTVELSELCELLSSYFEFTNLRELLRSYVQFTNLCWKVASAKRSLFNTIFSRD